jgi:hypothetical protein
MIEVIEEQAGFIGTKVSARYTVKSGDRLLGRVILADPYKSLPKGWCTEGAVVGPLAVRHPDRDAAVRALVEVVG